MSQSAPFAVQSPTPSPRADVRGAIANASAATGVDFGYLLGQARMESSLDPSARAGSSSAAGLFQFTSGTWLSMLRRHGAENGLGWASDAIASGRISDPAVREQVLSLRYDPQASALMAGELAAENRTALTGVLGREPDASELYLAHFLGADGAGRFLTGLAADPGQSAAALLPKAAAANRAIFFDDAGAPRSLGGVMDLLRTRMGAAMEGGAMPAGGDGWAAWGGSSGWNAAAPETQPQRPSMAETLAAAFGGADASAMPAPVRAAYGKLQAFGL